MGEICSHAGGDGTAERVANEVEGFITSPAERRRCQNEEELAGIEAAIVGDVFGSI
jgi:hypothetical protein